MQAVNIHGPHDVRVDDISKPTIGPRDILIKIAACGICGSDLTFAKHGFQREGGAPWPLGHEAAGTVVDSGPEVENIPVGLRVAVNPMGNANNIIGNGGSEGAFADYLLIRDAVLGKHVLAVPDSMPSETAALIEPFAVALHGVNQGKVAAHEKVAVFGAGPIGLAALFWLKRRGVRSIVSIDLSDSRLAIARQLGATDTINPANCNLIEALTTIHGPAPAVMGQPTAATDLFIDMAGGPSVIADIVKAARFHARLVVTAAYATPIPVDFQTMMLKELTLTMAIGYPTELPEVLATLNQTPEAEIAPYVSHKFTFKDFGTAFNTAKSTAGAKVMVSFG
jgi:(R,R)-butanediol dehydrogenase/meso-butanediol dehydrogenase/diacetyl reductase